MRILSPITAHAILASVATVATAATAATAAHDSLDARSHSHKHRKDKESASRVQICNAPIVPHSRDLIICRCAQKFLSATIFPSAANNFHFFDSLFLADSPPTILSAFTDRFARSGDQVSLSCSFSGKPVPRVQWTHDGSPVGASKRLALSSATQRHQTLAFLNISSARVEDSIGEWTCRAVNALGAVEHSARVHLYSPPFVKPFTNVTAVAGHNLTLQCPFGGYPVDSVTWKRSEFSLS